MKLVSEPVEIVVEVNASALYWPEERTAQAGENRNRTFSDLSGADWSDVDDVLRVEGECLERCFSEAVDIAQFWIRLEASSDEVDEELFDRDPGVDLGVMAAVVALNAARCPTFISCIGHGREPAYINFWARRHKVPLLCEAAAAARIGLYDVEGIVAAYSDEPLGMLRFARELRSRSAAFRATRSTIKLERSPSEVTTPAQQTELPFDEPAPGTLVKGRG